MINSWLIRESTISIMSPKTKLYLFIGYPGAGKTEVAKIIAKTTGAYHIWADVERHKMFKHPTHSIEESDELYAKLDQAAEYLLSQHRSVVFDTNFNHKFDRDKLRSIAEKYHAETILIWVKTPLELARQRAVMDDAKRNHYDYSMSLNMFEKIVAKLEPPTKSERAIIIDGRNVNEQTVMQALGLLGHVSSRVNSH